MSTVKSLSDVVIDFIQLQSIYFFFIICNPLTTYKHYNFDLFLIIIFFVWPIFHGFYTVVVLTSVGWTNCSCFDQVYLFLCPRYIT